MKHSAFRQPQKLIQMAKHYHRLTVKMKIYNETDGFRQKLVNTQKACIEDIEKFQR